MNRQGKQVSGLLGCWTHTYSPTQTSTHLHTPAHKPIHNKSNLHTPIHAYTNSHSHTLIFTHTHTHSFTLTLTYTYTHTYLSAAGRSGPVLHECVLEISWITSQPWDSWVWGCGLWCVVGWVWRCGLWCGGLSVGVWVVVWWAECEKLTILFLRKYIYIYI